MCLSAKVNGFASNSMIVLLDFGTVPTVWYFVSFLYYVPSFYLYVSMVNYSSRHDISEKLLKWALNTNQSMVNVNVLS